METQELMIGQASVTAPAPAISPKTTKQSKQVFHFLHSPSMNMYIVHKGRWPGAVLFQWQNDARTWFLALSKLPAASRFGRWNFKTTHRRKSKLFFFYELLPNSSRVGNQIFSRGRVTASTGLLSATVWQRFAGIVAIRRSSRTRKSELILRDVFWGDK